MEYVIAALLFANILLWFIKKGNIKIDLGLTITHKYDGPTTPVYSADDEEKLLKEQVSVIGALNEFIEKGGIM